MSAVVTRDGVRWLMYCAGRFRRARRRSAGRDTVRDATFATLDASNAL
jgi:hypothetical protein